MAKSGKIVSLVWLEKCKKGGLKRIILAYCKGLFCIIIFFSGRIPLRLKIKIHIYQNLLLSSVYCYYKIYFLCLTLMSEKRCILIKIFIDEELG